MTIDELKNHPFIVLLGIAAASISVYTFITRK